MIVMHKVTKSILTCLAVSCLFFSLSTPALSQDRRIYLDFRNQILSADIKEAPLKAVIKKIKEKKGIWFKNWFKGREFLLDEKVSVQFRGLSIQDGMERIFCEFNHSLIFRQGRVVGVMLFGKPDKRTYRDRRRTLRRRR